MQPFKQFLLSEEKKNKSKELHAFDMDETLFAHDNHKLRVFVLDKSGNKIQTITNSEFSKHKLEDGQSYDFSEFKSSELFTKHSKPIKEMIGKLKKLVSSGHKVVIITARTDLDDQEKFAHHMMKYGIDIGKVHVHRAGNLSGKTAANKALIVQGLIDKHGSKKVHFYDDHEDNIDKFLKLKTKNKEVELHAHHVLHDRETGKVNIKTTSEIPKEQEDKGKNKK
jgi:hydroxymethylpyrimidine pyrophosphatase-like HAD family hydrolase